MKSYTTIEQSKKLSEILPLESADMWWSRCTITNFGDGILKVSYAVEPCNISQFKNTREDVPCWSLAALLDILKDNIKIEKTQFDQSDMFTYSILGDGYDYRTYEHENLVDACVEMILKLHELNLLCL